VATGPYRNLLKRLSEKVQLGENVLHGGEISPAAFERGLNCLRRFKLLMRQYPLKQYWALGTNTFRVTSNAEAFLAASSEIGIDISIITWCPGSGADICRRYH
jgi:exopolyphosphatase/guanosine-5'-triphosphate,3'-diphosphate pyrophosphatase